MLHPQLLPVLGHEVLLSADCRLMHVKDLLGKKTILYSSFMWSPGILLSRKGSTATVIGQAASLEDVESAHPR